MTTAFVSIVSEAVYGARTSGGGSSVAVGDGPNFFQKLFGFNDIPRGIVTIEELNYPGRGADVFVTGSAPGRMVGRIYSPLLDNVYTGERFYSSPRSTGAEATQAIQGGSMMLGADAIGGACMAFPSACYTGAKLAGEGALLGSGVRLLTGQSVNVSTLGVDAALGIAIGVPFSALGAASGPVGEWVWRVNSYTATVPMSLPPP